MDPEPATDTPSLWTRRHIGGNLESGLEVPGAHVVNSEDGEVFGLHIVNVGLVGNADSTARNILLVVCMDGSGGLTRAGEVGVEIAVVSSVLMLQLF